MVAYSFKTMFADRIRAGENCQTIRADRKRHARPGEKMQIFTGMRTKHCERLIPDPLCISVEPIRIDLRNLEGCFKGPESEAEARSMISGVTIDLGAERLSADQCEALAVLDGFGGYAFRPSGEPMSAMTSMVSFWIMEHGPILFEGVLLCWENPQSEFYAFLAGLLLGRVEPIEGSSSS